MLEIVQLSHILNNTSNAEKAHLAQQENIPLYHGLAAEREEKKKTKRLKQVKKSDHSETIKVNDQNNPKKRKSKKRSGHQKKVRPRPNSPANNYLIDIEI